MILEQIEFRYNQAEFTIQEIITKMTSDAVTVQPMHN